MRDKIQNLNNERQYPKFKSMRDKFQNLNQRETRFKVSYFAFFNIKSVQLKALYIMFQSDSESKKPLKKLRSI